ncbi:MAG: cysteate synthase [Spirochaetaceae bacterium]
MKRRYTLRSPGSGRFMDDDGLLLTDHEAEVDALLRSEYGGRDFSPGPFNHGLYRFDFWLPTTRRLTGSCAPVTYRSTELAAHLGLSNLYVTFSGYWPERNVTMLTGTFKECEAYSVCARIPEDGPTIVVASAGNTARAFARVCSTNRIPLVLVIPEPNLSALWQPSPLDPCVTVVAVGGKSDYADAIRVAGMISDMPGYHAEGGARNVARRDGMGTTILSAVETIGSIPEYYFQAVGSGTGAIAAWEANERLIRSGRFGSHYMRLMVSQNSPFQPIYDSWRAGTREITVYPESDAKARVASLHAMVLANRTPPYSVQGGLYDALIESRGDVLVVDNDEAEAAAALFSRLEGVTPSPAASVAVASLINAARDRTVPHDATIMLNITGGGFDRIHATLPTVQIQPDIVIPLDECRPAAVADRLRIGAQADSA